MKWTRASEKPPKAGWYHTDLGLVEWGTTRDEFDDGELFWLNRNGGYVTKWLDESSFSWNDADMKNAFDSGMDLSDNMVDGNWNDFDTWLTEYKRTYDPTPDNIQNNKKRIWDDKDMPDFKSHITPTMMKAIDEPLNDMIKNEASIGKNPVNQTENDINNIAAKWNEAYNDPKNDEYDVFDTILSALIEYKNSQNK